MFPRLLPGLAGALALALLLPPPSLPAATATWTNVEDGSVGYWTNAPNWNAATFPGNAAGESAWLTNATASSYTAVYDRSLASALNSLVLSNAGGGAATLIVTNAALTNAQFVAAAGGVLLVDSGGLLVVTNAASSSLLGNGGRIVLNGAGLLKTSVSGGQWNFGGGTVGTTGLVTSTSAQGGTWDMGGNKLYISQGSGPTLNSVLAFSKVTLTNVGVIDIGIGTSGSGSSPSTGNSLVISNGARLLSPGSTLAIGLFTNDSNNRVQVGGEGEASLASVTSVTVGGGDTVSGNSMVITNALLTTTGVSTVGNGGSSSNNSVSVLAGGTWNLSGGSLRVGSGSASKGNSMTVAGGTVSNASTLNVGYAGSSDASFTLQGGMVSVVTNSIATSGSSVGTLTVNGGLLNISGPLTVGGSGGAVGSLVVHGGTVSNAFTSQNNSVGGSGGTGTIFVDGGSVVFTNGIYFGGNGTTGNGFLTVTGGSFSLINPSGSGGNGYFMVGSGSAGSVGAVTVGGSGSLTVIGGNGNGVVFGGTSGGTGTVLVTGGSMTLANPGSSIYFANGLGSYGSLVVSNGTSVLSNAVAVGGGRASVGVFGQYGGTNSFASSLTIGNGIGATGTFTMAGGLLNLGGNLVATNSFSGSTQSLVTVNLAGGTIGALGNWTLFGNARLTNAFGGSGTVTFAPANAAQTITLSGVLSGNGSLVKDGAGALALTANNTYTGSTILSNGAVIAAANTAFGTGVVRMLPGTVLAASNASPDTLLGVLDPTSSGTFALAANTPGALNFASRNLSNLFLGAYLVSYTNGGVFTPYGTTYKLGGGGGTLVFTNPIAGASNLVIGAAGNPSAGRVLLTATNPFSGGVALQSGILQLGTLFSSGSGAYTALGGGLAGLAGNSNSLVLTSNLWFSGTGWGGNISGAGQLLLTNAAAQNVVLAGSNNTYSGGTLLAGVNLTLGNSSVLGVGTVVVGSNVVLTGGAGIVPTNAIQLVGNAFAVMTANSTFAGAIDLMGQTNATIGLGNGLNSGRIFSLLGPVTNGVNVVIRQAPYNNQALGPNPTSGVQLGGSNAWTGITLVDGHILQLVSNSGSLFTSTNLVVASAGTLSLNNLGTPGVSRLDPGAQIALSNGTFQVIGPGVAGQVFTQQVGAVTVAGGGNVLWTTNRATFAMADLLRSGGGTLNLVGTNSSAIAVSVADAPDGLANGIVPWVTVNGTDLAGWSGGQLGLYSGYLFNTTDVTVTNAPAGNWKLTNTVATTFSVAGPAEIGSLVVASNGATLNLGGAALKLASGSLLQSAGALALTNGTLDFGAAQGLLNVLGTTTNWASLAGSAGFAKAGAGTLLLGGTNAYGGDTFVNQGSVVLLRSGAISNAGTLYLSGTSSFTVNGAFTVGNVMAPTNAMGANPSFVLGANGALTTFQGATLVQTTNANFNLGAGGGNASWTILGGTASVAMATRFSIGEAENNNTLWVTGGAINVSKGLYVGNTGSSNLLFVGQGGQVTSLGGSISGANQAESNNVVIVTDGGVWNALGAGLTIGSSTNGSALMVISNGGRVSSGTNTALAHIGATTGANSNSVLVVGGSWSNALNLIGVGNNSVGAYLNRMTVTSSSQVFSVGLGIGKGAGSYSNVVTVSDPGTLWNLGAGALSIGPNAGAAFNQLYVLNGAVVTNGGDLRLGDANAGVGGNSNLVVVAGGATLFASQMQVGMYSNSIANQVFVTNGGALYNAGSAANVGGGVGAAWNSVVVSGSGSLWSNQALTVGNNGSSNSLQVLAGGRVISAGNGPVIGNNQNSNSVVVAGPGSWWSIVSGLSMGNTGSNAFNNTLVISNGGLVTSSGQVSIGNTPTTYGNLVLISQGAWTNAGTSYLVYQGTNNRAVVEGPGAVFHSTGDLYVGYTNSAGSSLLVSNGAVVSSLTGIGVGMRAGNSGTILVTGPGSILRNLQMTMGSISAGSNSWSLGSGSIVVTNGGTLEGNYLRSGYLSSGGISNLGGIYQFFSNSPVIEANTAGTILLNGGAISFRDVANANVKGNWGVGATGRGLTNLTFVGNNTFRLNNSSTTNAGQEYVFDAGRGATNYVGLEMVNGNTAWRSAWLAIGPGGSLLVSNTTADIYGALTNSGNITVASASASYWSNVVLNSGSLYRALAGTNAFNGGLVINDGATMTMDAWSTLTGTVTNNSLLQILTNAVYAVTGGQAPAGNGALNVSWGGALTYSNGAYAGFGGGGVTNNGLVDVQNLAVVTLGGSAGTPSGNGVLRVSGGGALNFGPGSYAVGNTVSNLGTVMVSNALVTFHAPVVIGGTYVSDPSTNVFTTNVTVSASGALVGSNGDLFVFQKDLYMFSTNHTGFNMWQAATLFTNGPSHFLSISNSGAFKLGGGTNLAEFATNFAIGELGIALGDKLTLAGNKDTLTNALYVGWLNIYGLGSGSLLTNDYLAVSNTLVTVLSLDVNLYYDKFDSRNDWLTTYLPDLGYDLWGPNAGLLLPIPEPSALLAVGAGLAVLAFLRRRRA